MNELWSDWLIKILIANSSKLHIGQEVPQTDTQRLYYDLGDMHTPSPIIEEDMQFSNVLSNFLKKKIAV